MRNQVQLSVMTLWFTLLLGASPAPAQFGVCISDQDCDDGNPQTIDRCEFGVCVHSQISGVTIIVEDVTDAGAAQLGLSVCRIYVQFDDPQERLLAVGGANIFTPHPAGLYQHSLAGDTAPDESLILTHPDAAYDTYVTVGLPAVPNGAIDGTVAAPGFAVLPDSVVGAWYNNDPPNGQGNPDGTFRVMIGQFSRSSGAPIEGAVTVHVTENGGPTVEPCQADFNNDGVVDAADELQLLNAWGPCPGCLEDLNGDGVVDDSDLSELLTRWGPCGVPAPIVVEIPSTIECNQPAGACCLPEGACIVDDFDGCASVGGLYAGDGTSCNPNPCAPPPPQCLQANGDFDGNGVADGRDIQHLVECILSAVGNCQAGDFSRDGVVGMNDALWFEKVLLGGGPEALAGDCWSEAEDVDPFSGLPATSWTFGGNCPPIPDGFFGENASGLFGEVPLGGRPIDAPAMGGTDTVIRRDIDPWLSTEIPSLEARQVCIQIIELSLVSTAPISVLVDDQPTLWNVDVDLSSIAPPSGRLTATKTHTNGGTYDAVLHIQPIFTFTRTDDPTDIRVFDTGLEGLPATVFQVAGAPWVHHVDPSLGVIAPPGSEFVPGVEEDPITGDQTLVPVDYFGYSSGQQCSRIRCRPPMTP